MKDNIGVMDSYYSRYTKEVKEWFTESVLTSKRMKLECAYVTALVKEISKESSYYEPFTNHHMSIMDRICDHVDESMLRRISKDVQHEVKAIEYYLRQKFKSHSLPYDEMIHFGLTSQDIIDPVYSYSIKKFIQKVVVKKMTSVINALMDFSITTMGTTMMSRTHGQPATPTLLGKEVLVYVYRLIKATKMLYDDSELIKVKFGGAVGNMSVHHLHFPDIDWSSFMDSLMIGSYGMERSRITTQVNGNDDKAKVFMSLVILSNILIDMSRDFWQYCSLGYFTLNRDQGYVGSSTMAHKNNPIEFENAEGNLEMLNEELMFMANKLSRSRMQRDLSDSTIQKNYGQVFSRLMLSLEKLKVGIQRLNHDREVIRKDLEENPQCVSEFIQTKAKLVNKSDNYDDIKQEFMKKGMTLGSMKESAKKIMLDDEGFIEKVSEMYYVGVDYQKELLFIHEELDELIIVVS